jgi:hypothetical protein
MSEWIPSDKELIEVLCRVRETDWTWADYRANRALAEMMDGTVQYDKGAPFGAYGRSLWKKKNFTEIPEQYMNPPSVWRKRSLNEVLDNITKRKEPEADGYRDILFAALERYQEAAECLLLDKYRRIGRQYKYGSADYIAIENKRQIIQKPGSSGYEYMPDSPVELEGIWPFLGAINSDDYHDFHGEMDCLTDEDLVKKVIAVQELKRLIYDRLTACAPPEQTDEPLAVDCAGEDAAKIDQIAGRGYQPKQDIIDRIEGNKGSFRGWKRTAQNELDTIQKSTGSGRDQLDKKNACEVFYCAYEPQFKKHGRDFEKVYDALRKSL